MPPTSLKLLYVARRLPYPPNKGERIRAYHQIRELAKGHRVHLACPMDRDDDVGGLEALRDLGVCVEVVGRGTLATRLWAARGLLPGPPRWVLASYSARLANAIRRRLDTERFDALFASGISAADYVRSASGAPRAVDLVDVVSELSRAVADRRRPPLSWLQRAEARRLARYEERIVRSFDLSIFASEPEARLFGRRRGDRPVAVVGNGVDLEYFTPWPAKPVPDSAAVVFTGTMDYFPNVDAVLHFCRSVLPHVTAVVPETHFYVVGRNPTGPVRALARGGRVTVTGSVPDVRAHLARATVAVAPLRIAPGIQNKVLEAMAMGIPVVATSVALEGLSVADRDGARRADDPATFAREILALLRDPGWRRQCSLQARHYVERCHRWEAHGACLGAVLETMIGERERTRGGDRFHR
jgi:sugar transferase (PEP-CTERM/EpsH1 system associated)